MESIRETITLLLYRRRYRNIYCKSTRRRNRDSSFWYCCSILLYTKVSRIRCYQGYWRRYICNSKFIYWIWFIQEVQWCSRKYYFQSTGETVTILFCRIWNRESYIQSSRGRNQYTSSWRSSLQTGQLLCWKWHNSYIWRCIFQDNETIRWLWFTQEILRCCREYYLQPT